MLNKFSFKFTHHNQQKLHNHLNQTAIEEPTLLVLISSAIAATQFWIACHSKTYDHLVKHANDLNFFKMNHSKMKIYTNADIFCIKHPFIYTFMIDFSNHTVQFENIVVNRLSKSNWNAPHYSCAYPTLQHLRLILKDAYGINQLKTLFNQNPNILRFATNSQFLIWKESGVVHNDRHQIG